MRHFLPRSPRDGETGCSHGTLTPRSTRRNGMNPTSRIVGRNHAGGAGAEIRRLARGDEETVKAMNKKYYTDVVGPPLRRRTSAAQHDQRHQAGRRFTSALWSPPSATSSNAIWSKPALYLLRNWSFRRQQPPPPPDLNPHTGKRRSLSPQHPNTRGRSPARAFWAYPSVARGRQDAAPNGRYC
jgi:hypothetical protein